MTCPVLNLFSKCHCCGFTICGFCLQLTILVMACIFGVLFAWKPKKAIGMQTAFYRLFNWKLEPISMAKEIRNTRIMGTILLVLSILALVFILLA